MPNFLYAITITATLTFGGGQPMTFNVDIYPAFYLNIGLPEHISGFTIPYLIMVDEKKLRENEYPIGLIRTHEYGHIRQAFALGPLQTILYGVSFGHLFEDYLNDDGYMWESNQLNFPFLRIRSSGDDIGISFLPGWNLIGGG